MRKSYNSHQLRRIISLDKMREKRSLGYTSPQRSMKNKRTLRKKRKKRVSVRKSRFFGECRLGDLTDKILNDHIFPFVDVYSIVTNVCLVCVKFNKISMSSTVGREIKDPQTIELVLYHKPCDTLLYRLLYYRTLCIKDDPSHVFQFAVKYNRNKSVRHMIETKLVDPSCLKNYAIQTASECGHLRIVKLLLADERVDPSVRDFHAIRSAWYNGHIEVVKCLLRDSKLKKGRDLGYIPDYVEMMKSTGADIVELMDNEDRKRLSEENNGKKIKNVIVIKKRSDPLKKGHRGGVSKSELRKSRRGRLNRSSASRGEEERRKINRLSPIAKKAVSTPVNPKARRNLDALKGDDNNNASTSTAGRRGRKHKRNVDTLTGTIKKEEEKEEEEELRFGGGRKFSSRKKKRVGGIDPDSILFDHRLRELEVFARDMLFNRKELERSITDSSFGEEQFEELDRLREESGLLRRRITDLEKSVDEKQIQSEEVLGRFRSSESKKKYWKNVMLSVVVSWILMFVTFLVFDFYFPVQMYHGFFPS